MTCSAPASRITSAPLSRSSRSGWTACSAISRLVLASTPSELVMVTMPGRPRIRPTRTVPFSVPAASLDSSSGRPRSTAQLTASPSSMTTDVLFWWFRRAAPRRLTEKSLTVVVISTSWICEPAFAREYSLTCRRPHRSRVSRVSDTRTVWPKISPSSRAISVDCSAIARSPLCSVLVFMRRSSCAATSPGIVAICSVLSIVPPSSAMSRIIGSDKTGCRHHPFALEDGATNTPTGRSTVPTGPSCSSARRSHVGEAMRQDRRLSGSKLEAFASAQCDSSSAAPASTPSRWARTLRCVAGCHHAAGSARSIGRTRLALPSGSSITLTGS